VRAAVNLPTCAAADGGRGGGVAMRQAQVLRLAFGTPQEQCHRIHRLYFLHTLSHYRRDVVQLEGECSGGEQVNSKRPPDPRRTPSFPSSASF